MFIKKKSKKATDQKINQSNLNLQTSLLDDTMTVYDHY